MALKEITSSGQIKQGIAGPTGLILDRMTTAVTVNNNATEQTLYSFTIPANTLATSRGLRFTTLGLDHFNNSGGNVNFRWKLKLGGTTVFDTANQLVGTGANRGSIYSTATGLNLTASSQIWSGFMDGFLGGAGILGGTLTAAGQGTGGASSISPLRWQNTSAVDTTAAQAFAFTITMGTANALAEAKLLGAILELL